MAPQDDAPPPVERAEAADTEEHATSQAGADALPSGPAADDAESDGPASARDIDGDDAAEDDADADDAAGVVAETGIADRVPVTHLVAAAAVLLTLFGLLGASGYMLWQSHQVAQQRAREADFTTAARQGVANLLSLDFNKGDADVKRLIDSTTGPFREDFLKSQNDFLMVMKDAKVVTTADIRATAVESMTEDSAEVLVAAASYVSNSASAQQPARGWRLAVTVQREDGQLKMSKVEFVP